MQADQCSHDACCLRYNRPLIRELSQVADVALYPYLIHNMYISDQSNTAGLMLLSEQHLKMTRLMKRLHRQ